MTCTSSKSRSAAAIRGRTSRQSSPPRPLPSAGNAIDRIRLETLAGDDGQRLLLGAAGAGGDAGRFGDHVDLNTMTARPTASTKSAASAQCRFGWGAESL